MRLFDWFQKKYMSRDHTGSKDTKWNYCPFCGKEIQKEWHVCPFCGNPLCPVENNISEFSCVEARAPGKTEGLEIVDGVLVKYTGTDEDVYIPEGVTAIKQNVFEYCKIKRVFLPEGLKEIGDHGFADCSNLEYINIPASVNKVGQHVFFGCLKLQTAGPGEQCNIQLDNNMQVIPRRLFYNCQNLCLVNLPEKITVIEEDAFWNCMSLERIVLPESCKAIGNGAFADCGNLQYLEIKSKTIKCEGNAFKGCCRLSDKDGFLILNDVLYFYCGGQSIVTIPYGIREIAADALEGKHMEEIVIPETVISIGDRAFARCDRLKKVLIPSNVQKVGKYLFAGCESLETFVISDQAPEELKHTANFIREKNEKKAEYQKLEALYPGSMLDQCLNTNGAIIHPFFKKHITNRNSAEQLLLALNVLSTLSGSIYTHHHWDKLTADADRLEIEVSYDIRYIETSDSIEYRWSESRGGFFDDSWSDTDYYSRIEYVGDHALEGNALEKNPFGIKGYFKVIRKRRSGL